MGVTSRPVVNFCAHQSLADWPDSPAGNPALTIDSAELWMKSSLLMLLTAALISVRSTNGKLRGSSLDEICGYARAWVTDRRT